MGDKNISKTPWVGRPAIDFNLLDSKEKPHRLKDYTGCWVLMVFHRHLG